MRTVTTDIACLVDKHGKLLYGRLAVGFKGILRIGTEVAVAGEFRIKDMTDGDVDGDISFKACRQETPVSLFLRLRCHDLQTDLCLRPPGLMAEDIVAHTVLIACLAIVNIVEGYTIDA